MSIYSTEGTTNAEKARNVATRAILRMLVEASSDKSIAENLQVRTVAIGFEKTLTGAVVTLFVTDPLTQKALLRYRLSLLATLTTAYNTVGLTVDSLEIEVADEDLFERLKRSDACRKAMHESCVCTLPPAKTLTELYAEESAQIIKP